MHLQPSWNCREGAVTVTSNAAGGGLGAPLTFQQEHLHGWLLARHNFLGEGWGLYKENFHLATRDRDLLSHSHIFRIRHELT